MLMFLNLVHSLAQFDVLQTNKDRTEQSNRQYLRGAFPTYTEQRLCKCTCNQPHRWLGNQCEYHRKCAAKHYFFQTSNFKWNTK